MGVVSRTWAFAALACVAVLAVFIGLVPQPADAQEDIASIISEKKGEPKWLRGWRLRQNLEKAARLDQQANELYWQGRYAEAELLYERVLTITERTSGTQVPLLKV